jgi:hypothetical protein
MILENVKNRQGYAITKYPKNIHFKDECGLSVHNETTGLDDPGIMVRFSAGTRNFLLSIASGPALRSTYHLIQRVAQGVSPEVKRPQRESDHSFPSSADIKNA